MLYQLFGFIREAEWKFGFLGLEELKSVSKFGDDQLLICFTKLVKNQSIFCKLVHDLDTVTKSYTNALLSVESKGSDDAPLANQNTEALLSNEKKKGRKSKKKRTGDVSMLDLQ